MDPNNFPPEEAEEERKPIVKNPVLNFVLMENSRSISNVFKRMPILFTLTILLFTIMITIEGSWGEIFDLLKTWIVIGLVLAIWIGIMLGLSRVVGAKAAGIIGGLLFLAVPIGFLFFIVACWGGGC